MDTVIRPPYYKLSLSFRVNVADTMPVRDVTITVINITDTITDVTDTTEMITDIVVVNHITVVVVAVVVDTVVVVVMVERIKKKCFGWDILYLVLWFGSLNTRILYR